jgi:hypothetical protein
MRPSKTAADDIEELAYPPDSGGKVKMALLGIILPIALACYAGWGFAKESFYVPERGGEIIHGTAAKWLALCHFGAAATAHFRWWWGLLPSYRIFTWGSTLAMILWISGCAGTTWELFFY